MISRIHQKLGTAGFVISIVALVMALTGAAYAAGGLSKSQEKQVRKLAKAEAKKYAGKQGPKGAKGDTGPAGPTGPAGTAGANGKDGANGTPGERGATGPQGPAGPKGDAGAAGAEGKSVENKSTFTGADEPTEINHSPVTKPCQEAGGAIYEVEETEEETLLCNGKEGSPWMAGGTLPPGATETGTWTTQIGSNINKAPAAMSFVFPLKSRGTPEEEPIGVRAANIVFKGIAPNPRCPEGNVGNPTAAPGVLCIYTGLHSEASEPSVTQLNGVQGGPEENENETSLAGAFLYWKLGTEGYATGSFAVTGCSTEAGNPFPCP